MLLPAPPPVADITPAAAVSTAVRTSLAAQWTTTLDTAQDVTGLEASVSANDVCFVNAFLTVDAPAGGMKIALDAPAGSIVEGWIMSTGSTATAILRTRLNAISTLTASIAATARGTMVITLRVVVGATGGTLKLQACSTTATQSTVIDVGSIFEVIPGASEV